MVRLETVKGSNFLGKLNRYKENVSPSNATVDPYDADLQILDFESLVPVLKTRQAGLKKASGRFQPLKRTPPSAENRATAAVASKPTECVPSKQPSITASATNPAIKRKSHEAGSHVPSSSSSSSSPFSPLFCPPQKKSVKEPVKEAVEKSHARNEGFAKPASRRESKSLPTSVSAHRTAQAQAHTTTASSLHRSSSSSLLKSSSSSSSSLTPLAPLRALKASMDSMSLTPVGSFQTPRAVHHRRRESPRALEPLKALDNVPNALMKLLEDTPAKQTHKHHKHSHHDNHNHLSRLDTSSDSLVVNVMIETASKSKGKPKMKLAAKYQVFASKDMLLSIARFLPGLELARLSLVNSRTQGWLSDPNHRLWHHLCVANFKKFRFPKREEDSWKRRYLQSLEICEACDHLCPAGFPGAVIACISCRVQYCGFNPPDGHVRFPTTPGVKMAPRRVGMCYEQCWALCWRCNDLIVMQTASGETGAVCRSCCPPDREVCEQCREALLLAHTKAQWEARRSEHRVARVLGLADPGEFAEIDDDGRSVASHYSGRYERAVPEESLLDTSAMFDPYL